MEYRSFFAQHLEDVQEYLDDVDVQDQGSNHIVINR